MKILLILSVISVICYVVYLLTNQKDDELIIKTVNTGKRSSLKPSKTDEGLDKTTMTENDAVREFESVWAHVDEEQDLADDVVNNPKGKIKLALMDNIINGLKSAIKTLKEIYQEHPDMKFQIQPRTSGLKVIPIDIALAHAYFAMSRVTMFRIINEIDNLSANSAKKFILNKRLHYYNVVIQCCNEASVLCEELVDTHRHVADLYFLTQERDKEITKLMKIVDIDPHGPEGRKAQDRLDEYNQ